MAVFSEPAVLVALIAAITSLVGAILSHLSSRKADTLARRAEEAGKRSEQLRLKGTEAGEKIFKEIAVFMIKVEKVQFLLHRQEMRLTEEQIVQEFVPLGEAAKEIRTILYSTAIYTTAEIKKSIIDVLDKIGTTVPWPEWLELVQDLQKAVFGLSEYFYDAYLRGGIELEQKPTH